MFKPSFWHQQESCVFKSQRHRILCEIHGCPSYRSLWWFSNIKAIKSLQAKPQIVVEHLVELDLIERRKLLLEDVQFLVLDEADEMLSMGFQDELDAILANTPEYKQTLCFSATMPEGMKHLTKNT